MSVPLMSVPLSPQNYGERLAAQIIAAVFIIGVSVLGTFIVYGLLYITPIKPFVWVFERYEHTLVHCHCLQPSLPSPPSLRIFFLKPRGRQLPPLRYKGGWLLTSPEENFNLRGVGELHPPIQTDFDSEVSVRPGGKNGANIQVR